MLDKEARPGQSLLSLDPEFPLIFYTPLKIIDARLLNGRIPDTLPDWILPQSASGLIVTGTIGLGTWSTYYDEVVLQVENSSRYGSIPDPDVYRYRTKGQLAPFVIYRRKAGTASTPAQ